MQEPRDNIPPDPLIDEIRAIRKAISEEFGNDVERLCNHLREMEKEHPERIVDRSATDRFKQK